MVAGKDYYEPIKKEFEELFKAEGESYFEITAGKRFTNKLKEEIPSNRNIIYTFLKKASPDITGFLRTDFGARFVVIEIKDAEIELDHIFQARKYTYLFDARYAFLVSTHEIPVEVKELSKTAFILRGLPFYGRLTLVQFDKVAGSLVDWYEENPFMQDHYWR